MLTKSKPNIITNVKLNESIKFKFKLDLKRLIQQTFYDLLLN
jgi:hypothetical protein